MLYNVYIWAASQLIEFVKLFLLKPVLCKARGVFQVIVLLEIYILLVDIKVSQGLKKVVVKDLNLKLGIHVAFNVTNVIQAPSDDTASDHDIFITVLYLLSDKSLVKFLPWFPLAEVMPIQPKKVEFELVKKYHKLPVLDSPVLICFHPFKTLFFFSEDKKGFL